jgi:hypothetical protein
MTKTLTNYSREDNLEASQAELKYLRIQLQAIEVQASEYTARSEDLELTQSIRNWKAEYEGIDKRTRARKMLSRDSTRRDGSRGSFGRNSASVDSPRVGSRGGTPR